MEKCRKGNTIPSKVLFLRYILEKSSQIQTLDDDFYLNLTKWLKDDFRSRVYTANTPREKIEDVFFNWKMKQAEASYMIAHYKIWNLCILCVFLSLMCYSYIFKNYKRSKYSFSGVFNYFYLFKIYSSIIAIHL